MPKNKFVLHIAVAVSVLCAGFVFAQDGEKKDEKAKPKHSIKDVMKGAMKGKDALNRKVLSGKASAEEKLALLDMYVSLIENKPPKGSAESWQKLAGGAALAAAKVAVGRKGAEAELKAATNCKACHDPHKK